ncbi:MAG: hypothetical protein BV459_03945, partial [Thermoplasmata archaeon M11B2D]
FFDVIFHLKNPIERQDGRSISNFWAFVQHLQEQHKAQQQEFIDQMFDELKPGKPTEPEKCPQCNGTGFRCVTQNVLPNVVSPFYNTDVPCSNCGGTGKKPETPLSIDEIFEYVKENMEKRMKDE